jgi:signal transduction histidine kinase/HAMP domain-containing protein
MKLKIRHKLAIWMVLIGIVPAFLASGLGVSFIVSRLKDNLNLQTKNNLRIGINLLMEHVDGVKNASLSLSKKRMIIDYSSVNKLNFRQRQQLIKEFKHLGHGIIQILDKHGELKDFIHLGEKIKTSLHEIEVDYEYSLKKSTLMIKKVLNNYAHTLDIYKWKNKNKKGKTNLYIRSISPLLDKNYNLKGAIVVTVILDELFCNNISAILGSNILLFPKTTDYNKNFVTSFKSQNNSSFKKSPVSQKSLDIVFSKNHTTFVEMKLNDNIYSVAFEPIHNNKGIIIGTFSIAKDITALQKGRGDAVALLIIVGIIVLAFMLILAIILSKSFVTPLANLVFGAKAVAKGKLDNVLETDSGDEIGELAKAFNEMVRDLKQLRDQQSEQMSEIQTLNEISNAISVQVGIDNVVSEAMKAISVALQSENGVFFLKNEEGEFKVKFKDGPLSEDLSLLSKNNKPFYEIIREKGKLLKFKLPLDKTDKKDGVKFKGTLITIPVNYQNNVIAVIYLHRDKGVMKWGEPQTRVLNSVSERLGIYVLNAQLFEQIYTFNEHLESMVDERTTELQNSNEKLGNTLSELKETQVQVMISERLAGLGSLLAGVAHEINTPIGAIDAAIGNLRNNIKDFFSNVLIISDSENDPKILVYLLTLMSNYFEEYNFPKSNKILKKEKAKDLAVLLKGRGVENTRSISRKFVEMEAEDQLINFITQYDEENPSMYVKLMYDLLSLNKSAFAISTSIQSIRKIVLALRSYSHVKQDKPEYVNIHDVIETSLIILANKLKHNIEIQKDYGNIVPAKVYGDELGQVWVNLILNATQAINGKGVIKITTKTEYNQLVVSITDSGKGIPDDVIGKVFEPFFTTKKTGEGTGLGLGIVSRIVKNRHGGDIKVESKPGETTFTVYLPLEVNNNSQ